MEIKDTSPKVFVIIPVHNRKNITLKCLQTLKENGDLDRYNVVVVDDGSTDGTSEGISQNYPTVYLLRGNGHLYWTGAIAKGMRFAYQQKADFMVWLNDDTLLEQYALPSIINYCRYNKHSVVGVECIDPNSRVITFGGYKILHNHIERAFLKESTTQECDCLNGNVVCFPASVVDAISFPDYKLYPHNHADFIYTYKAKKAGYKVLILGGIKAFCINEHKPISWLYSSESIFKLYINSFWHPKSYSYWKGAISFQKEMFGYGTIKSLYVCIVSHIRFWVINLFFRPLPLLFKKELQRIVKSRFSGI